MSAENTGTKPLKTQPKNVVRRSKAEREALGKDYAQREEARARLAAEEVAAQEAQRNAKYNFGEGRASKRLGNHNDHQFNHGRVSRGGFMGASGNARQQIDKSEKKLKVEEKGEIDGSRSAVAKTQGPKSSAPTVTKSGKRGSRSKQSAKVSRNPAIKQEDSHGDDNEGEVPSQRLHKPPINTEYGGWISSDSDELFDRRVDIEHIDISSSFESDSAAQDLRRADTKIPVGQGQLRPVRLRRSEHQDRVVGINTEASVTTITGSKRKTGARNGQVEAAEDLKDLAYRGSRRKGKERATITNAAGTKVKKETSVAASDLDSDSSKIASDTGTNAEASFSTKMPKMPMMGNDKLSSKERSRLTRRLGHLQHQVEEEYVEEATYHREIETLQKELGKVDVKAHDSSIDMPQEQMPTRDGNVYLWQFPPRMPEIAASSTSKETMDEDNDTMEEDIRITSETSRAKGPSLEETIKVEEDADRKVDLTKEESTRFPAGKVGKLRVHKSGRTTLDWAGTTLDINMGMDAQFLQTATLITLKQHEPFQEAATRADRIQGRDGEAVSLGQIRGKFVATPDWSELL